MHETITFTCPKCKCQWVGQPILPEEGKKKFTTCPECGHTFCGMAVECYSRVVGYYRPKHLWNKGKQEEFKDRREFEAPSKKALKKHPVKPSTDT